MQAAEELFDDIVFALFRQQVGLKLLLSEILAVLTVVWGTMRFMNYFTKFFFFVLQNRTLRMQQGRLRARTGKVSWQFVLED